eukprot:TRINITY_DN96697_c0_g1_i1.p1 TRINITY_DN96697_c0_g1~~TRINITY_DN96697_c0_g1_i1.p1  ORF type:complete len:386 (-),score=97.77 TRINITY_DN96697_c0_g1_i1:33-1190(-)
MKRKGDAAPAGGYPASSSSAGKAKTRPPGAKPPRKEEVDAATALGARRAREEQQLLRLSTEGPANVDSKDFCGAFAALGIDNSWDTPAFKKGFSIQVNKLTDDHVEFDMVGIDPPLANAFRRILIAEVPTVAISRVTVYQNTGVIHDENLAHRLGLIPIKFEPENLEWKEQDAEFSSKDSIMFELHKTCPQGQDRLSVYSRDLCWKPLSEEQEKAHKDNPPVPVEGDILIAVLKPGQEIECECFCEKGIGKEHAKWSPVCTAFYRLHPEIRLQKEIKGQDAKDLKKACPMGVFDIEDAPGVGKRAIVANARQCTTCRECLETFPGEEKGLLLAKRKDHFIFSIESVGQLPAPALFERALLKLKAKCETAKEVLAQSKGEERSLLD